MRRSEYGFALFALLSLLIAAHGNTPRHWTDDLRTCDAAHLPALRERADDDIGRSLAYAQDHPIDAESIGVVTLMADNALYLLSARLDAERRVEASPDNAPLSDAQWASLLQTATTLTHWHNTLIAEAARLAPTASAARQSQSPFFAAYRKSSSEGLREMWDLLLSLAALSHNPERFASAQAAAGDHVDQAKNPADYQRAFADLSTRLAAAAHALPPPQNPPQDHLHFFQRAVFGAIVILAIVLGALIRHRQRHLAPTGKMGQDS
jgi:hypothetical protein